jgi:hypothetical protein
MAECVPRPFTREVRVRQVDGPILTAKLPSDLASYSTGIISDSEFDANLARLHQELSGEGEGGEDDNDASVRQ